MNQNTSALGAAGATLFRGEKVAVELNSRVVRSGREKVRVRVFGNGSFPWQMWFVNGGPSWKR